MKKLSEKIGTPRILTRIWRRDTGQKKRKNQEPVKTFQNLVVDLFLKGRSRTKVGRKVVVTTFKKKVVIRKPEIETRQNKNTRNNPPFLKPKNHSRICSKTVVVSGLSDIVIEFINVRSYYFRHFDIKSWFALLFLEFFFQIKGALRSTVKILEGRKTKPT